MLKKKLNFLDARGLSLIEVVVALFIFIIVVAAFPGIVNLATNGIVTSGLKNNALYTTQQDIENAISNYNNSGSDTLTISFPSPIEITGSVLTIDKTYTDSYGKEKTLQIVTFVPNE